VAEDALVEGLEDGNAGRDNEGVGFDTMNKRWISIGVGNSDDVSGINNLPGPDCQLSSGKTEIWMAKKRDLGDFVNGDTRSSEVSN
jgi:hypothetical protein